MLRDTLPTDPGSGALRFLAILSASGSGKSSLARAGLLPALRDGRLDGGAAWPQSICRPGFEPFRGLATALTPIAPDNISAVVFDRLFGRNDGERSLHVAAGLALGEFPPTIRSRRRCV
jgi:hypothetical protein